jgi:hypothetical protein
MIDAPRPSGTLSARDQAMAEPRVERYRALPRVSIATVTGIGVPPRIDLVHFGDHYTKLGHKPVSVLTSTKGNEKEHVVVGPKLGPEDVLALLDFVSPDKQHKANIAGIIHHWDYMTGDIDLAKAHERHVPRWKDFLPSGEPVIDYLVRNSFGSEYDVDHQDKSDVLIPVFRWKTDAEGNKTIISTPLTTEEKQDIVDALPVDSLQLDQLNEAVGLSFLAAFSPVITTQWPSVNTYHPQHIGKTGAPTQEIDYIQALALTYRMVADLQRSSLLADFDNYAETGIPPVYDPLQAIRRNVLDFLAGYDLTKRASFVPISMRKTHRKAEIVTSLQGYPVHRAKTPDGLTVTLFQPSEDTPGSNSTSYELERVDAGRRIRIKLTDFSDRTSTLLCSAYNNNTASWDSFDHRSPVWKGTIQNLFGITLS